MKIVGTPVPYPEKQQPQSVPSRFVHPVNTAIPGGGPLKGAAGNAASLAALGLQADGLSDALVSFVKFFSLPLERGLLTWLRRQVLAGQSALTAGIRPGPGLPVGREALAFAAAAAASKGVTLSAAGLERYAAAIDPALGDSAAVDSRRTDAVTAPGQYSPDERGGGGQNFGNGQHKQNEENQNGESRNGADTAESVQESAAAGPLSLKEKIIAGAGEDPLLDTMNRLPGTDRRRWLVFPFEFAENGERYRAVIRIALDENAPHNQSGRMVLDIVTTGSADRRRWLFVMDCAGGNGFHLNVFLRPPRSNRARAALGEKLSALTGIPVERVTVQNGGESFLTAAEGADEAVCSVDEEA